MAEDTVSADEEDDEVKAHNHPRRGRASVRHDAIVHHSVPVFSGQDLKCIRILILWENNQQQFSHMYRVHCHAPPSNPCFEALMNPLELL